MLRLRLTPVLFLLLSWLPFHSAEVRAQWHAPATAYHDPVQRMYPVELARVLAWRENAAGRASIAEVRYTVGCTDDGTAIWNIQWIGADGKAWRSIELYYKAELLLGGAKFYREIADKFFAQAWVAAGGGNPGDVDSAFWQGLGRMKSSRMATLRPILEDRGLSRALDGAEGAARLSGNLLSATVPGTLGGFVTIDSTLAARGAAWLALAELGVTGRESPESDARWAVVLWLARRESQAGKLWAASVAHPSVEAVADTSGNVGAPIAAEGKRARLWWEFILGRHTAREAYLQATRYDDPAWGLPLLALGGRLDGSGASLFAECARILYPERLDGAHDYASWIGREGGVSGAHYAGFFQQPARADWFKTINLLTADEQKPFEEVDDVLAAVRNDAGKNKKTPSGATSDGRVGKTSSVSSLVRLMHKHGAAPLAPVCAVTPSDLMNFGWELHGLLARAGYNALVNTFGLKEDAQKFKESVVRDTPEIAPFLQMGRWDPALPDIADYSRFLLIENSAWVAIHAPDLITKMNDPAAQRKGGYSQLWMRSLVSQNWLMFLGDQSLVWHVISMPGNSRTIVPFAQRVANESGQIICRRVFKLLPVDQTYLLKRVNQNSFQRFLQIFSAPISDDPAVQLRLKSSEIAKLPPLERARVYEAAFWSNPLDGQASGVYDLYIEARAIEAAKKFYARAVPLVTETVTFSNTIAPTRLALALLEEDYKTADEVLAESATYSAQDLINQVAYAAARGKLDTLEKTAKACIERYPGGVSEKRMKNLLGFLPLWTAITTPNHKDREKALDYFADINEWPTLQWILLKQTGMGTEDAVRFLGGDKATGERLLMVDYLRGDKDAFERDYETFVAKNKLAKMARVVIHQMRAELQGIQPVSNLPDICPSEPQSIPMAVQTARVAYLKSNINERLAALSTEEVLWNHIEALHKNTHSENPDLRARRLELEAANSIYARRYPNGPHVWETKLQLINLAPQKTDSESTREAELAAIADATEAPLKVRFAAAIRALSPMMFTKSATAGDRAAFLKKLAHWRDTLSAHENAPDYFNLMEGEFLREADPAAAREAFTRAATSKDAGIVTSAKNSLQRLDFFAAPFSMSFTAVDGRKVDSAALRGKVVLVDFWATWCAPCTAEIPDIVKAYEKYKKLGFEIVGISLDTDKTALEKYTAKNNITWPNYLEISQGPNRYAVEWSAYRIPARFLIDKDGRKYPLARDCDIDAEIQKLLQK